MKKQFPRIIPLLIALLVLSALAGPGARAAEGSGTAVISPSADVIVGTYGTWTITYTSAETFSVGSIEVVIPDGWSPPQILSSLVAGYVRASTAGTLGTPAITISGQSIIVNITTLGLGQTVAVIYGDVSVNPGGAARAQTYPESNVPFLVRSDPNTPGPRVPIASSPTLDVVVGGPTAGIAFVTPPRVFPADSESSVIRLSSVDAFGNSTPVSADLDVYLSSSAPTGRFSHLGGAGFSDTDTVTIAVGTDTVSFYYRDTVAGVKTITASAVGQDWADPQQSITVLPGTPFRLLVAPADTLAVAGDYVRYRLLVEDAFGNPSPVSSSQTISLFGQPGSFYTTGDHSTPIAQIVIPSGSYSISLDYRNTLKELVIPYILGLLDQDGVFPTLEAASAAIYIDHAPYDPVVSDIVSSDPSAVADGVDSVPLAAHILDEFSNGIEGATVAFEATGSGNTIIQPAAATDVNGLASGSIRSLVAESKTVTASSGGIYVAHDLEAVFVAGPFDPSVSDIAVSKTTATADGVDSIVVTVTVRDGEGNPISGSVVALECTGSGNDIRQPGAVTNASGVAVGSVASTVAEGKTIRARANGIYLTELVAVSFVTGPFDPSVSDIAVSKTTATADGVDSIVVTVTVRDGEGNPISGSVVALECTGSGNDIRQPGAVTNASGVAVGSVASTVAEGKTIRARANGIYLTEQVAVSFMTGPFDPSVSDIAVSKTTATADGVDSIVVTVTVRDGQGNPISGSVVALECTGSGNDIRQPGAVTNASGVAVGSVASTVAEGKTIRARANGIYLTELVAVSFVTGPFDPSVSDIAVSKTTATADGVDSIVVTVTVRDGQGNPISGSVVALECTGSGNDVRQPGAVTNASGVAVGSVASTVAEGKTIRARANGIYLTEQVAVSFVTGPFDPSVSDIAVSKTTATADGVDSIVVTVTVRDGQGNPISGSVVALECTGSGNDVRQPGAVTNASGVAVGSVASTVAEGKTIRARANGIYLTELVAVSFVTGPFDPSVSDIAVSKTTATADGVDSIVVTVTVRDGEGNPISGSVVALECTGSGNDVRQPGAVTNASGVAVGSVASTVAEGKTIRARANGIYLTEQVVVSFVTGPFDPSVSDIAVSKTTATADGVDSIVVTVTVRDGQGNPISGSVVALECTGSGNDVRQPGAVTNASGVAVGSVASTVAEGKTIRARANGIYLTELVAVSFVTGPFDPSVSDIAVSKTTATADGVDSIVVTVTVRDGQGNPISGSVVALECTGTENSIRQPGSLTDALGRAVGSVKSTAAEGKTISALVDAVYLVESIPVSFVTGPFDPSVSDIAVSKTTATADGVDSIVVTVTVRDGQGNPISGKAVTIVCTGTENSIRQPGSLTDVLGRAVGSVKSTAAEGKTIRALVDAVYLAESIPVTFAAGPFSPDVSDLDVSKTTITADGADSVLVTVTVRDGEGNPISGSVVALECTGSGNDIRQPVGLTGPDGLARGGVKSTVAETKTIRARVDGALVTAGAAVSFVPGPFDPVVSEIQVDKTAIIADGADAVIVTVYVRDADSNPIPGVLVTLECTGSGNTIAQPSVVTGADGRAAGSVRSTVAEIKSIRARAGGALLDDVVPVAFTAGALHHFIVTHGGTATAGVPAAVSIDARDANNNKLTSFAGTVKVYPVRAAAADEATWGLGNAAGFIVSEAGDTVTYQFVSIDGGDAELLITDRLAESITIAAASGGVSSASATALAVSPAGADRVYAVSGDGQRAVVNTPVPLQLVVAVEDAFGNRVPGVTVAFAATAGGGAIDASVALAGVQTTAVTGGAGTASCEYWRLGTVAGLNTNEATAAISTGTVREAVFTATTDHGPVASVALAPASKPVTVNTETTVTATLRDGFNNLVFNENVTIYIKDTPADGYLSAAAGSTTEELTLSMRRGTSDSTGTVSVTYHAPASAGAQDAIDAYTNTVSSASVVDAVYSSVSSGATDLRATVLAGATSQAGITFSFVVEAVDGNGNRDLANSSRILLQASVDGGFSFSLSDFGATITEADLASGAVIIYGRGTRAGSWQIDALDEAAVLAPAQIPILIVANDVVSSYVVTAPAAAVAGAEFAVTAEARDLYGNRVASAGYTVDFRAVEASDSTQTASSALSPASGTLVNGLFAGANFRYTVAEPIRVEVSSVSNAVKGYSGAVSVGNAAAYQLVKIGGDSSGVAVGDSVRLAARVLDAYGNTVDGHSVFFTVQEGGGAISSPLAVSDAAGVARAWFRTDTLCGTNRARAAILDASPEGLETQGFTVTTVPRSAIDRVALSLPGTSFTAGEMFTCEVAAYDVYGNLIDTDSSTGLRAVAERASIDFTPDVMTLLAGVSSFTAFDSTAGANRIAVLSLAGDTLAPWSAEIAIEPAAAYRVVEVNGDTSGVIAGASVDLRARVTDRYGNAAPDEIVRFQVTSDLGGSPVLWDGTGAANDGLVLTDAGGAALCALTTDANAGVNSVSASILDASPPLLEQVVFDVGTIAGTIARFDVIPDGFAKKAGESFAVEIIAYDGYGNEAFDDDTTRVLLASDGSATFAVNPVTLSAGRATASARDTVAELLVLRARTLAGGATSYSGTITVSPEAPSGAIGIATVIPDTITANGTSTSAISTGAIRDVYGNVVAPGTLVRVTASAGTVISEDKDPSTPLTVERQTEASGAVSVFVRSATSPAVSTVEFQSVTGSAVGSVAVVFAPAPVCLYAGYLAPRHLLPTEPAQFRCSTSNTSPTGTYLSTATTISFADSLGHVYEAHLAAPAFLRGSATDTLDFQTVVVPAGLLGGTYTPRVALAGNDIYGFSYRGEFSAGSNSVSVSDVDILQVVSEKAIVSRGDTFTVDVRVRNGGGSTVSVIDITLKFANGFYGMAGDWNPPLPDDLAPGAERLYRHDIFALGYSPLGFDTIDASITAQANGSQVQDQTAYPNVSVIFVQAAASLSYVASTLDPDTVSRGQTHSFSLSVRNAGDAALILDPSETRLSFTDGADAVSVPLGYAGAIPGNTATALVFPPVSVPTAMDAGSWPVAVRLRGTENGGFFDTTLVLSDEMRVVDPAAVSYVIGTLAPAVVSKQSDVSFGVGVANSGGASVLCDPDSTWFTFTDGSLTYAASLDATRGRTIDPGVATLYFRAAVVPSDMAVGSYPPSLAIGGSENGLRFASIFALADSVGVQEPSQLAITSTTVLPAPMVTADQATPWFASVQVRNNGGATVRLESFSMRLLAGPVDVTGECILAPLDFTPNVDSLLGGETRAILVRLDDNPSGAMTTGTIVIESALAGRDLNSGASLLATTEYGGKGSYLVQTPASLVFAAVTASTDTVTALQTKDWFCDVAVRNAGQSDLGLDLDPAASFIAFSTSGDFIVVPPVELAGGGVVLEGGSTDTLRWRIDRSGSVAGPCVVESTVRGTELTSGRIISLASGDQGISGDVLVQTPAALAISRITPLQNPVTVSQDRAWSVEMEVRNTGQSDAALELGRIDSTRVVIPGGSGFVIDNPLALVEGGTVLRGGAAGRLVFTVSTTGMISPGTLALAGSVLAVETTSDRHVFASRAAPEDTVTFELPPDPSYVTGSLAPLAASSGTSVSFEAAIAADAGLRSTLTLDRSATTLSFGDADGDTVRTSLSDVSPNVLPSASQQTLLFDAALVDVALSLGRHAAFIRLVGEENGNPFSTVLPLSPDSVLVEQAPQLGISGIVTPQSVTRSQTEPWNVWMKLRNSGEASVSLDLAAAKTFLTFTIVGVGDRTYEYTVVRPAALSGIGGAILPGGAVDSLLFTVTSTGSTPGIALVNGTVTGTDVNSNLTVSDDTYSGGFSHVMVELPGDPAVVSSAPSRATVTSAQTTPWQIACEVCNAGEADLTLIPDSARVYRDEGLPLAHARPPAFVEGGLDLPGGECRHLVFSVSPTPEIPAGADIELHADVELVENNNGVHRSYDTRLDGSGSGSIRVQAQARLAVALAATAAPRAPYVDSGQQFVVVAEVANGGEARVENVGVALEGSGSSAIADTLVFIDAIAGFASASDTFLVTADGEGSEIFTARIRSAVDANSGESDYVLFDAAVDDTALAVIQRPAALVVTAVTPSQEAVNAGQTIEWTIDVGVRNDGEAPLEIDAAASDDLAFSIDGVSVGGYLVIAPETFVSGASPLVLEGGAADTLLYRIAATGRDTGSVDIAATLGWIDGNEPEAPRPPASGSGSVLVRPPSGLRIVAVTSDAPNNASFANTSIVNTGQTFNLTVRVENTGGDDLDSVLVRLATSGVSGTLVEGDSLAYMPSRTERDFVYAVTAAPSSAVEYLRASIVKAVSVNTGEPVTPAEAVESIENLRIETAALLACGASITSPAGAIDDTLSTGQIFVVTVLVENAGEAAIDTTGRVTLALPVSMSLADPADPLTRRFDAGAPLEWTLVAPAAPSLDTLRASISSVPNDINIGSPAAIQTAESRIVARTEEAGGIAECSVSVAAPAGAVDGVLSTDQEFVARVALVPSVNADSVWAELSAPAGYAVAGDMIKFVGAGAGELVTLDWTVRAPSIAAPVDTLVGRAGGVDANSGERLPVRRVVFAVRAVEKAALALAGRISGPDGALDGILSVNQSFTIEATAANAGEAGVDTAGARIELVLPSGQNYDLDGAGETYRKPFYPGEPVAWNVRAPAEPTSPGNLQIRFVEPLAEDVNTNLACAVTTGEVFLPVQTETGAVRMLNLSSLDTIPPVVVPQGAAGVPIMRAEFENTSGYTIGLDTLYVAIKDGTGRLVSPPSRRVSGVALVAGGVRFEAAVSEANPVPIVAGHAFEVVPGAADTLLLTADIAANAPAGEIRFEIEESADVVFSITLEGGGAGSRVGVVDDQGGDIAGSFLSGPLTVLSARFEDYVHNYPNPFAAGSQETRICYFLLEDAAVSIRIYDLAGILVWTKEIASGEEGGTGSADGIMHEIPWDGRNARGETVRNGVYLCKVEAGSQSALFKIAVAK